jgi:hypothetical protein
VWKRVRLCSQSVRSILCCIGLAQMSVLPSITARMLLDRGMTLLAGFRIASETRLRCALAWIAVTFRSA